MPINLPEQDVFAVCMEAAVALGAELAPRLAARAGELMLLRAAQAARPEDRQELVEGERFLSLRQSIFAAAYPVALRAEFTVVPVQAPRSAQSLSFESLELMQEDQVDETVEVLRGQQMVLSDVEAELGMLNALISAAQGRKVVSASANPFRPEAWVRALRDAARESRVPAPVRARWLQYLCEALGPELAHGYRLLCDLLRQHGVAAASFAVSGTSGSAPLAAVGAPAASPPALPHAAAAPVLNLRDLRRLLAGEEAPAPRAQAAPQADAGPTQDQGLTVPWAFDALQQMKGVDQVLQRMQRRRATGDAAQPLTPAQALGQEVVKVMIENITTDERLAQPVRQVLVDLQPALQRLARNDPRFFRDKDHPTRRFLSEVTERGLAWPAPDAPGFTAFFAPVREAVDALSGVAMDSAEPFEVALQSMEEAWAQEEARSRQQRARAAEALIRAEKRNLIALEIADQLRARPDVAAAPAQMRRFVTGAWSQVIAAARMRDGGTPDAQAYADIINDLIWSTQPRLAAANRVRLARLVPPLLATLRRGLASIEYPAQDTQRFLDELGDLHQLALRPPTAPAAPAAPTARDELDARLDQGAGQPWLEPEEARDSGLMEWSSLAPPSAGAAAAPVGGGAPARALSLDRFQAGIWVDLLVDGAWSRWRLAWVGTHSLLFMFTDGAGGSRSMTRGTLEQMIAQGGVRLVAEQPVLSGALDAVATRALRNSVDTTF